MMVIPVLLTSLNITTGTNLDDTFSLLVTDSAGNTTQATIASVLGLLPPVTPLSLGLGNVANLSPSNLPISYAVQQALSGKLDVSGSIGLSQVTGLQTALTNLQNSIITASEIDTILGYTPVANTPAAIEAALGYTPLSSITSADIATALGYTPVVGTAASIEAALGFTPIASTAAAIAAVLGFAPVANSAAGIEAALGYTPLANTASAIEAALGYTPLNKIAGSDVIIALGYTPVANTAASIAAALGYAPLAGITSSEVVTALGFTPLADTLSAIETALGFTPVANTAAAIEAALGYVPASSTTAVASITSSDVVTALGYTPVANTALAISTALGYTPLVDTAAAIEAVLGYTPVANTPAAIEAALGYTPLDAITSSGVITALGYTPLANTAAAIAAALGYVPASSTTTTTSITSSDVVTALGFTPVANTAAAIEAALGYTPIAGITSTEVDTALGYTPLANTAAAIAAALGYVPAATSSGGIVVEDDYLPLGTVPLTASLVQTTNAGVFVQKNVVYTVPTYTKTYQSNSDTYEYINVSGNITSLVVAAGATAPATPAGYIPFQKVQSMSLATPLAPKGIAGTGGTLAAGTHTYQIVMVNASGKSLPSPVLDVSVAANGSATVSWRMVPYATSTEVYRDGYLLSTVSGQTYTDTGTATTTAVPTTNTSNFIWSTTPLYDVVRPNGEKIINLGAFGLTLDSDITALLLGLIEYGVSIYTSGNYPTQYGIQPSYLINAVRIIIPDGKFYISQGITVPPGITLDCYGLIVNNLNDLYTPCLTYGVGSFSNNIQLNANNGSGIQLGEVAVQNNMHLGNIRIANVGGTYNNELAIGQQGLTLSGYNITIDTLQVYLGSIGLVLYRASDVRIGRALVVGPYQGFSIAFSEQVSISYIDVDTPTGLAGMIDTSHNVMMNGALWINGATYGGTADKRAFLQIGTASGGNIVAGLNCKFSMLNCGVIPILVENIDESTIDVVIGTGHLYTGTQYPPQSVISYGSGVGSGFLLRGTAVIPTMTNWNNATTAAGGYSIFINGTLINS